MKFETYFKHVEFLKDYRGATYTDKLLAELQKGNFEESQKKTHHSLGISKKAIGLCINPLTWEIEDIGGSSLLLNSVTNQFYDNLWVDNFGLVLQLLTSGSNSSLNIKDDVAGVRAILACGNASTPCWATGGRGATGRLGSGTTAPTRADTALTTNLASGAPENAYLGTSGNGYTGNNQIIFNLDASPTGGAGTMNESGLFSNMNTTASVNFVAMFSHEILNSIAYTAGKLLRSAYTIQI